MQSSVIPVSAEGADLRAGSSPNRAIHRACHSLTKAGEPCRSTTVGADGYCGIHRPGVDPVELGRAGGIRSGEVRREQAKSVRDRLREKVEEQFDTIWQAFEAGLLSDDDRARVAAAVAAIDQAYGRPPQAIVGDPDQPVAFVLDSLLARAREGS